MNVPLKFISKNIWVHPLSSRGATPLILTTPNRNSQKVWVTVNMISPNV